MESDKVEEIITATKTIIENCVYGDIDVNEMPTFDIEYIFLQLRGKAKGEVLELKYNCPVCEAEIPLREVLELTNEKPLYGHRSGKKAQTHWVAFINRA
jgi:hypothetical protein